MHLGSAAPGSITETLEELARRKGYGKIFAKIPVPAWPTFESVGYVKEAEVPGFFNGRTDRVVTACRNSDAEALSRVYRRVFRTTGSLSPADHADLFESHDARGGPLFREFVSTGVGLRPMPRSTVRERYPEMTGLSTACRTIAAGNCREAS